MKFERVSIHITNHDENNATVKLEFFPPLPEDENDIEEQPCLNVLDILLDTLTELGEADPQVGYLQ
jgi:hypothetical protein